jgi:hypothetical protein
MRWLWLLAASACSFRPASATGGDAGDPRVGGDAHPDAPHDAAPPPVPAALAGMRWAIPCTAAVSGNPQGCYCNMTSPSYTQVVQLAGSAGERWQVDVQIAGAMEQFQFENGSAGGSGWYVGGDSANDGADNWYEIAIDAPPAHYYVNSGHPSFNYSNAYDYAASFEVDGDAVVTFTADPGDNLEWQGIDMNGSALAIAGFTAPPPVGGLFGQWAYVVVTSATRM